MPIFKEPGFIIVLVCLVIFYFRIIQLRGKKRKLERKLSLARLKNPNKKVTGSNIPAQKDPNTPPFAVTSWILVIIAAVLMLFGTAVKTTLAFSPAIENIWWVPTAIGILLFTFCFKIEV